MKKIVSILLSVVLIFSLFGFVTAEPLSSQLTASMTQPLNFTSFSKTAGFHFDFQPAGPVWKNIVAGQQPARLGASYTLKDNVVKVGADFDVNIKSASQMMTGGSTAYTPATRIVSNGAFVSRSVLESAAGALQMIQPDTVFVNETTGTAFKVVVAMDGDESYEKFRDHYAVTQPQIHEVVDEFKIPASDVTLNKANITSFAGVPASTADSIEDYILKSDSVMPLSTTASPMGLNSIQDPLIEFSFPEGTELNATSGGQNITVKVSGGLGIGNLGLEAKYSGFDGYYFALKIDEEAYLNVDVGINTNQEIRIPILGIDVPFGIGRVSGGLFVVVGLDGKVTIQMEAREYISSKMGVKGDTFLYAPVSCKPFFNMPVKSFSGDVQVDGKINGYVKAGALLSLEIFGWDLVGAGVFIGSGVNIISLDGLLDIELYGLIQVYITFAGDTYYLIHSKPTLLRKQQKDMGGYRATIEESCAYQDIVVGFLQKSVTSNGNIVLEKAGNTPFDLVVTNPFDGNETVYPTDGNFYYTDPDGRFLVRDYPDLDLNVNDRVGIRVFEGSGNDGQIYGPSQPVSSTYPFRNIRITAADAFNDWIEGQVEPARVRNWDQQPGEEAYKMLSFSGQVGIDVQLENSQNYLRQTLYTVHVSTDQHGAFRAYNGGLSPDDPMLDVQQSHRFTSFIDQDEALVIVKSYLSPYTQFSLRTVSERVPGSSNRYMEGTDTIDQVRIKTRLYVINMGGSRQLTGLPASVILHGLSTQDRGSNGYWAMNTFGEMQYYGTGDGKTVNNASHDLVFKSDTAIPIENNEDIQLINDQTNGTSYVDLTLVKEWVWPAHSNPTIITSPDHTDCTSEGGTFQVTATGDEPIRFSASPSIPGVALAKDGLMTMAPDLVPGVYKMTIEAAAKTGDSLITDPELLLPTTNYVYSEDPYPPVYQDFTLTVLEEEQPTPEPTATPTATPAPTPEPTTTPKPSATPAPTPTAAPTPTKKPTPTATPTPTAKPTPTNKPTPTVTPVPVPPTITSARSTTIYRPGGGTFQVTATGSEPITFSLSALPDWPIPSGVTINETTGLLTVSGWTAAGTHYFDIVATNPYGEDRQTFMLVVKSLFVPRIQDPANQTSLSLTRISHQPVMQNFTAPLLSTIQSGAGGWITNLTDVPEYVLRNDDPKDLYSQDMLSVSGAEYVKYDLLIEFYADGDHYAIREFDKSPCNDHHATPMTEDERQAIEDYFKNRGLFIEYDRMSFGPDIEARLDVNMIDDFMEVSVLDYGSLIGAMDRIDEGTLSINLGGEIGTVIPGRVFNALKDRAAQDVGLSLAQEEATMTFMSGSVETVGDAQQFDFAFSSQTISESVMKAAAGPDAASFTFAFAHNENLPGSARFDITTTIAAGRQVNVYRYETQSQQFSLIAESVTVADGGVVSYMNNTMSEYLITTARLGQAVLSDAYQLNHPSENQRSINWLYYTGGGVLILLIGGAVFFLLIRKKRLKDHKPVN